MSRSNIKIDNAIVCDDIRTEQGGKLLMIGVYFNELVYQEFPVKAHLQACLIGRCKGDFSLDFKIEFQADDDESSISREGSIVAENEFNKSEFSELLIPIRLEPMQLNCTGKLLIKIRPTSGKNWKEISSKRVNINNSSPS